MRDNWYDEKLNNRDWKAIQAKYQTIAAQAVDAESLATVVNLMLGELNGSHLGFFISPGGASPRRGAPAIDPLASGKWSRATLHPGFRLDSGHKGDGWKIRDLITAYGEAALRAKRAAR